MSAGSSNRINIRCSPPAIRKTWWDKIVEDLHLGLAIGVPTSFVGGILGVWLELQWADYTQNYRSFSSIEELKNSRLQEVKVSILIFFVIPLSLFALCKIGMRYNNSVKRKYCINYEFEQYLKILAGMIIVGLMLWNCIFMVPVRDVIACMPSEAFVWCEIYCLLCISMYLSVPNTISMYRILMNLPSACISYKLIAYLISNYFTSSQILYVAIFFIIYLK